MKVRYRVIGLMSGTSLDGLDICFSGFTLADGKWKYEILSACTIPYPDQWRLRLIESMKLDAAGLVKLDHQYGLWLAEKVLEFLRSIGVSREDVDLVASHGHTIFHEPDQGITYQLGCGPELMTQTGIPVVTDFRRQDIILGGQGAPLVPIGDQLLFSEYDACLNLGGFANISFNKDGRRLAFDICPVNIVMNELARELGEEYDRDGHMAASGELDMNLLGRLDRLEFYTKKAPKSLGAEWVEENITPILGDTRGSIPDQLRTVVEHIARQVSAILNLEDLTNCLVTGGGALNSFLVSRIREMTECKIEIPEKATLEFKEAVIFAFLGILRLRGETNALSSVTGASHSHSSGIIYLP